MPNEVNITITARDLSGPAFDSAKANMLALKAIAKDVGRDLKDIGSAKIDPGQMTASLNTLKAKIQSLGIADLADVNVQPGRISVQLNLLKRLIEQAKIGDVLDINANVADLQAQLSKIAGITETIPVNFKVGDLPDLSALSVAVGGGGGGGGGGDPALLSATVDLTDATKKLFDATSALNATTIPLVPGTMQLYAATEELVTATNLLTAATRAEKAGAGGEGGTAPRFFIAPSSGPPTLVPGATGKNVQDRVSVIGLADAANQTSMLTEAFKKLITTKDDLSNDVDTKLNPAVKRAGTNFFGWGAVLGGTIGGVGLLHVAIDAVIETIIAVGLAAASAAIGVAAMAPAAQDVYQNLKSIQTVNSALGSQIPPLTGQFQALSQSLAPQVIEAYGGGINILSKNTGAFGQTAHDVTTLVDDWVAKLVIWNNAQGGANTLLQHGTGYLSQFGSILGTFGEALGGILQKDPGIAHFLLDIIQGFFSLLNMATKLPGPLLEVALGLHGIYLWGSVLGGVLMRFVITPLIGMYTAISRVVGPMLGLSQASGAMARSFLGLSVVSWAWLGVAAAGLGILAYEMKQASSAGKDFVADLEGQLSNTDPQQLFVSIAQGIGSLNDQIQKTMPKIDGSFTPFNNALRNAGHNLQAETKSFGGFFVNIGDFIKNMGKAAIDFFPNLIVSSQASNSVTLFRGEIVKLSKDQTALASTTGDLVSQGYSWSEALSILTLAGVKYNDAADVQKQKVDNLIKGYTNIIGQGGTLTNSINAVNFATLQQSSQVSALNAGWDAFETTITGGESGLLTFASDLNTIATNAKAAGASMGIANPQSITLTQSFQQGITDANTYADKLTMLASASGGGADATNLLNKGIVDMVSVMLPAAKGSSTLTTELYALAQRGGYGGANSFKALANWVGNVKSPMGQLDKITTILTADAGNLTTDVQNLSTALGVTLTNAMATAIFQATGGQKFFNDFANAIVNTGVTSDTTSSSTFKLGGELYKLEGNVTNAKQTFYALAYGGLHLTTQQADFLWNNFAGPGAQAMRNAGGNADNLRLNHFNPLKQSIFDATTNAWNFRSSLINLPRNTDVNVNTNATGSGNITATENILGQTQKKIGNLFFVAEGGLISGGTPGKDSVLIAAMPGEVVVPTAMVNAGAVDHLRGQLPGFAAGGFVGKEREVANLPRWMAGIEKPFIHDAANPWGKDIFSKFMQDESAYVIAQIAAAQAAATKLGGLNNLPLGNGPLSGSAAVAQAFAKSILWAYGWNMGQWPYELALWNQESGWNAYAVNPASGAYGIPQSLGHGHPYNLGDYQAQIRWGDSYISTVYGNPQNAWAHEVAHNWYDTGGWLKPGWNPPMYNGTGRMEHLTPDSGPSGNIQLEVSARGSTEFEQFMVMAIRKWVVVRGAGSVQKAFGRH